MVLVLTLGLKRKVEVSRVAIAWNDDMEKKLLDMKDVLGKPYKEIATELGTTVSSVKHKYVRLKQALNDDKHHHPTEKVEQIKRVLSGSDLFILETNAGWGNLTKEYHYYGEVLSHDIDSKKVEYLKSLGYDEFDAVKCDSFNEIHRYIYLGFKFDVIDLDPYGFPSRYFPHVFNLIDDGILFVTFPKMGVQQINKIMKEHYRVFWGITLEDKANQEQLIHARMKDYAFQSLRGLELIDSVDLGRMFRFAYRVKRESALDLVGLKVQGVNC